MSVNTLYFSGLQLLEAVAFTTFDMQQFFDDFDRIHLDILSD